MNHLKCLLKDWYTLPRAILRLCFILLNNAYCIPTYVMWMVLLLPVRKFNADLYWKVEGVIFHWLLAMVSMWSWSAGYEVVESGDSIAKCINARTMLIVNHQSTGDVPLLMATFNPKRGVLPNVIWIMDNLFKYTNFGIVSLLHGDFFIKAGPKTRDQSLANLSRHMVHSFVPRNRKWVILFPEGGFLRKRKESSHRYAKKNNLPLLNHVSLPRVKAFEVIMDALAHGHDTGLEWILDVTIGYPDGDPIDLNAIIFGHRPPCRTIIFYRLYKYSMVPKDEAGTSDWLLQRWQEKERLLETFYATGAFNVHCLDTLRAHRSAPELLKNNCGPNSNSNDCVPNNLNARKRKAVTICSNHGDNGCCGKTTTTTTVPTTLNSSNASGWQQQPTVVQQDVLRFVLVHLFFMASTWAHCKFLHFLYHYAMDLVVVWMMAFYGTAGGSGGTAAASSATAAAAHHVAAASNLHLTASS